MLLGAERTSLITCLCQPVSTYLCPFTTSEAVARLSSKVIEVSVCSYCADGRRAFILRRVKCVSGLPDEDVRRIGWRIAILSTISFRKLGEGQVPFAHTTTSGPAPGTRRLLPVFPHICSEDGPHASGGGRAILYPTETEAYRNLTNMGGFDRECHILQAVNISAHQIGNTPLG